MLKAYVDRALVTQAAVDRAPFAEGSAKFEVLLPAIYKTADFRT